MARAPVFREGKPLFIQRGGIMVPAWAEDPCEPACCDDEPPPPPPPDANLQACNCCIKSATLTVGGLADWVETLPCGPIVWHWSNLNGSYSTTEVVFLAGMRWTVRLAAGTCQDRGILVREPQGGCGNLRYYCHQVEFVTECVEAEQPGQYHLALVTLLFRCRAYDLQFGCQATNQTPLFSDNILPGQYMSAPAPTICGAQTQPAPFSFYQGSTILTRYPGTENGVAFAKLSGTIGPCGPQPPTVTLTQTPPASTTDTTATFAWTTTGTIQNTSVTLDGGPPIPPGGNGTHTFTNLSVGTHTFSVTVADPDGATDQKQYTWQVTEPCVPPTVTLTQTPPATTSDTSATFAWTTTGSVATTTTRLDGGAPEQNTSGFRSYFNLSPGPHTFEVRVTSACGEDVEVYNWNISGPPPVPPTVTLTTVPQDPTTQTNAVFEWVTTGQIDSTSCQLDSQPAAVCTSPRSFFGLAPGTHTFRVSVSNSAGSDTKTYTWTITEPCTPPTVSFTQTPPNPTTDTNAAFAWTTTGQVTATTIRRNGGSWLTPQGANSHVYGNLAPGTHTVDVRVTGPCGEHTASYTWQITDQPPPPPQPPTVTLTTTPANPTSQTNAVFEWVTTGQIDVTECQLDGGSVGFCSTPRSYFGLSPGTHTFSVTVRNAAGSDTKTYSWTINPTGPTAPTVTLTQTPPSQTTQTNATFAWTTTGQVDVTECQLDGGAVSNCATPTTYTNLAPGPHTFSVTVRNAAGSDTKTYTWTINAVGPAPPTVTLTQTPPNPTQETSATFAWTTTGQVDATECQLDGNPPQSCTSPRTYTNLSVGVHTFRVTVSNAGGSDVEVYTWEITQQPPPPTTLCDKIVQLMQIVGGVANVDVEVTFSGVQSSAICSGVAHWNRSFLFPQPHLSAGACPNVAPGGSMQTQVCGTVLINGQTPTVSWKICTTCSAIGVSGPVIHAQATYPNGAHWDFLASGSQVEPLVDQLLASGQGTIPFHSQFNPSVAGQFFDFSNATCTIRVFN